MRCGEISLAGFLGGSHYVFRLETRGIGIWKVESFSSEGGLRLGALQLLWH